MATAASDSSPRRQHVWFAALAASAFIAAGVVWVALPHERELPSLWALLARLVPFVLATEAIAWLDVGLVRKARLHRLAIPATFLVVWCFFVPKIFFSSDDFDTLYYLVVTLTPFVILALVLAYRLGGGAPGETRRLSYAMLLLMLSGLEDLAFLTINPHTDPRWTPIPEVWSWATHMTVVLGHPATKYEAYVFIAVHVVLAVLVLFLPLRGLRSRLRLPAPARRRSRHAEG